MMESCGLVPLSCFEDSLFKLTTSEDFLSEEEVVLSVNSTLQKLKAVKQENFDLRLYCFNLEEKLKGKVDGKGGGQEFHTHLIELQVDIHSLQQELFEKDQLLKKANEAMSQLKLDLLLQIENKSNKSISANCNESNSENRDRRHAELYEQLCDICEKMGYQDPEQAIYNLAHRVDCMAPVLLQSGDNASQNDRRSRPIHDDNDFESDGADANTKDDCSTGDGDDDEISSEVAAVGESGRSRQRYRKRKSDARRPTSGSDWQRKSRSRPTSSSGSLKRQSTSSMSKSSKTKSEPSQARRRSGRRASSNNEMNSLVSQENVDSKQQVEDLQSKASLAEERLHKAQILSVGLQNELVKETKRRKSNQAHLDAATSEIERLTQELHAKKTELTSVCELKDQLDAQLQSASISLQQASEKYRASLDLLCEQLRARERQMLTLSDVLDQTHALTASVDKSDEHKLLQEQVLKAAEEYAALQSTSYQERQDLQQTCEQQKIDIASVNAALAKVEHELELSNEEVVREKKRSHFLEQCLVEVKQASRAARASNEAHLIVQDTEMTKLREQLLISRVASSEAGFNEVGYRECLVELEKCREALEKREVCLRDAHDSHKQQIWLMEQRCSAEMQELRISVDGLSRELVTKELTIQELRQRIIRQEGSLADSTHRWSLSLAAKESTIDELVANVSCLAASNASRLSASGGASGTLLNSSTTVTPLSGTGTRRLSNMLSAALHASRFTDKEAGEFDSIFDTSALSCGEVLRPSMGEVLYNSSRREGLDADLCIEDLSRDVSCTISTASLKKTDATRLGVLLMQKEEEVANLVVENNALRAALKASEKRSPVSRVVDHVGTITPASAGAADISINSCGVDLLQQGTKMGTMSTPQLQMFHTTVVKLMDKVNAARNKQVVINAQLSRTVGCVAELSGNCSRLDESCASYRADASLLARSPGFNMLEAANMRAFEELQMQVNNLVDALEDFGQFGDDIRSDLQLLLEDSVRSACYVGGGYSSKADCESTAFEQSSERFQLMQLSDLSFSAPKSIVLDDDTAEQQHSAQTDFLKDTVAQLEIQIEELRNENSLLKETVSTTTRQQLVQKQVQAVLLSDSSSHMASSYNRCGCVNVDSAPGGPTTESTSTSFHTLSTECVAEDQHCAKSPRKSLRTEDDVEEQKSFDEKLLEIIDYRNANHQQIEILQCQLTRTENDLLCCRQESADLRVKLEDTVNEVLRSRQEFADLHVKLQESADNVFHSRQESEDLRLKLEDTVNDLLCGRQESADLRVKLEDAVNDVLRSRQESADLRVKLEEAANDVFRSRQESEDLCIKLEDIVNDVLCCRQESADLRLKLEEAASDVLCCRQESADLRVKLEESTNDLLCCRQESHDLRIKLQEAANDLLCCRRESEDCHIKLEEAANDVLCCRQESEDLRIKLEDAINYAADLQVQLEKSMSDCACLKTNLDGMMTATVDKAHDCEDGACSCVFRNEHTTQQSSEAGNDEHCEIQRSYKAMREKLISRTSRLEAAVKQNAKLKELLRQDQSKASATSHMLCEMTKSIKTKSEDLKQLKAQMHEMQEKYEAMCAASRAIHVADTAAEMPRASMMETIEYGSSRQMVATPTCPEVLSASMRSQGDSELELHHLEMRLHASERLNSSLRLECDLRDTVQRCHSLCLEEEVESRGKHIAANATNQRELQLLGELLHRLGEMRLLRAQLENSIVENEDLRSQLLHKLKSCAVKRDGQTQTTQLATDFVQEAHLLRTCMERSVSSNAQLRESLRREVVDFAHQTNNSSSTKNCTNLGVRDQQRVAFQRRLHAVGRLDDHELVCKQVDETLCLISSMQARLVERLYHYKSFHLEESIDYLTFKKMESEASQLQFYLMEEKRLLRLFWTAELPQEPCSNQFEGLEVQRWRRKYKDIRTEVEKMRLAQSTAACTNEDLVRQLNQTERVLSAARSNLQFAAAASLVQHVNTGNHGKSF